MQKLSFINSKGEEVKFNTHELGVVEWNGLSECDVEIQSQDVPFMNGNVYIANKINQRELSFTVAINDGKNLQRRYEIKRELIAKLNPLLEEGYLYYENDFISKRIKCVSSIPVFPTKNFNDTGTLKASLTFTANNPFWEDVENTTVNFLNGETKTVENEGDVETEIRIEAETSGLNNFVVENKTTNQKIEIKGDIDNDFEVDTNFGKKEVLKKEYSYKELNIAGKDLINVVYFGGKYLVTDNEGKLYSYEDGNLNFIKNFTNIKKIKVLQGNSEELAIIDNNGILYLTKDFANWKEITDKNILDVELIGQDYYYVKGDPRIYQTRDFNNSIGLYILGTWELDFLYSDGNKLFFTDSYNWQYIGVFDVVIRSINTIQIGGLCHNMFKFNNHYYIASHIINDNLYDLENGRTAISVDFLPKTAKVFNNKLYALRGTTTKYLSSYDEINGNPVTSIELKYGNDFFVKNDYLVIGEYNYIKTSEIEKNNYIGEVVGITKFNNKVYLLGNDDKYSFLNAVNGGVTNIDVFTNSSSADNYKGISVIDNKLILFKENKYYFYENELSQSYNLSHNLSSVLDTDGQNILYKGTDDKLYLFTVDSTVEIADNVSSAKIKDNKIHAIITDTTVEYKIYSFTGVEESSKYLYENENDIVTFLNVDKDVVINITNKTSSYSYFYNGNGDNLGTVNEKSAGLIFYDNKYIFMSESGINYTLDFKNIKMINKDITDVSDGLMNENIYVDNENLFIFNSSGYENNLLNKITSESDMNLKLAIGKNDIQMYSLGGDFTSKVIFSNKYIGV